MYVYTFTLVHVIGGNLMEKMNQATEELIQGLLEQLELKSYGKGTLNNYGRILKKLTLYMQQNEIPVCGKINVHTIAAQKYTTPQAA